MTSFQSRLLVALVGVPVLLYIVLLAPEWALVLSLAALSGIAAYELSRCVGVLQVSPALFALTVLWAVGTVMAIAYRFSWLPPLLTVYCLLAFTIAVVRGGAVKFQHVCAALLAAFAIPYAFSSFLHIQTAGHRGFLLLPLVFSFASDTCAYFAGRAFGRHKLAPKVSPNKTVEGAIGGLVGDAAAGAVFALVMNTWFDRSVHYLPVMVLGFLCSAVAQLGDLTFSLIKREFGVKDYGKLFLAHGGVLDRFDSVIFVAPTLAVLLGLLKGGGA